MSKGRIYDQPASAHLRQVRSSAIRGAERYPAMLFK
jgi:hypothetical protein